MKHIKVTPAAEDEVIYAGEASVATDRPDPSPSGSGSGPRAQGAAEAVEPQTGAQPLPATSQTPEMRDGYREATLEDLRPQRMPIMQKAVITVAVVCIIGAVVYYFMFMR